jgi:uncharacterized membrane protein YjfL (UPF0719 family)
MGNIFNIVFQGFVGIIPYLLIIGVLVYLFKVLHDWLTKYDDDGEIRSRNFAVGLNKGALYLGLILAMTGSLLSTQDSYLLDLAVFALEGVIAVAVQTLASFIFDKVILPHIDNRKEIGEGNVAVAVVEAAGHLGLGFIMLSSFAGDSTASLGRDLLSGLVFSGLGLATLVLIYWLFSLLYKRIRKHSVGVEIANGNIAMAIEAGGVILAMSIVLGFSIIGDFVSWEYDILSYFLAALSAVLVVAIVQVISWFVFIRGTAIRTSDGSHAANYASATVNGFLLTGAGVVSGLVTFV